MSPQPAPLPISLDTFTDVNGTTLAAHTMDTGTGWSVGNGGTIATIQSNKAITSGGRPATLTNQSDVTVQLDFVLGAATVSHGIELYPRFTDASNFVRCDCYGDGTMNIYTRVAGTFTQLTTATWVADTGTHTLKVVASGATITCYLDGLQKMQATGVTAFQSVKNQGFLINTGDTADNWKVFHP